MLQQPRTALAATNLGRYTTIRCPSFSPTLTFGQKLNFPAFGGSQYIIRMPPAGQTDRPSNEGTQVASGAAMSVEVEVTEPAEREVKAATAAVSSIMEPIKSASSYSGTSRQSSMDMDKMIRPKRKRINPQQLETLLGLFAHTDTPSYELRERIGAQLGMSNREVQVRITRVPLHRRQADERVIGVVPEP